jgi:hypothetical protein
MEWQSVKMALLTGLYEPFIFEQPFFVFHQAFLSENNIGSRTK